MSHEKPQSLIEQSHDGRLYRLVRFPAGQTYSDMAANRSHPGPGWVVGVAGENRWAESKDDVLAAVKGAPSEYVSAVRTALALPEPEPEPEEDGPEPEPKRKARKSKRK